MVSDVNVLGCFVYNQVNYSERFIDTETGVQTQIIISLWTYI